MEQKILKALALAYAVDGKEVTIVDSIPRGRESGADRIPEVFPGVSVAVHENV